jgi:hypothetical protein
MNFLIQRELFWRACGFDLREKNQAVLELIWRLRKHGCLVRFDPALTVEALWTDQNSAARIRATLRQVVDVIVLTLRHRPGLLSQVEWGRWVKNTAHTAGQDTAGAVEEHFPHGTEF